MSDFHEPMTWQERKKLEWDDAYRVLDGIESRLIAVEANTYEAQAEISRVTNPRLEKIAQHVGEVSSLAWIQIALLALILWRVW